MLRTDETNAQIQAQISRIVCMSVVDGRHRKSSPRRFNGADVLFEHHANQLQAGLRHSYEWQGTLSCVKGHPQRTLQVAQVQVVYASLNRN